MKTHCARGHALTRDNLVINGDGFRRCRTCRRMARIQNMTEERRAATAKKRAEYNQQFKSLNCSGLNGRSTEIIASRPSDDLIADAQRRASAPRSLSATLLGDPPYGYSALDQRQSA